MGELEEVTGVIEVWRSLLRDPTLDKWWKADGWMDSFMFLKNIINKKK